jgi:transposase
MLCRLADISIRWWPLDRRVGMAKKYVVRLTPEERAELEALVRKGRTQAYRIRHANILLAVDPDGPHWTDEQAAQAFHCHHNTISNVRQRFVERGLEAALGRKRQDRPSRSPILDGEGEARLIAIACSSPPEGRARWTLKLLADRLVELEVVDSISDQTVRRTLKKTRSNRTCVSAGSFRRKPTPSS